MHVGLDVSAKRHSHKERQMYCSFLRCWLTSGLGEVELKLEIACPNFSNREFIARGCI